MKYLFIRPKWQYQHIMPLPKCFPNLRNDKGLFLAKGELNGYVRDLHLTITIGAGLYSFCHTFITKAKYFFGTLFLYARHFSEYRLKNASRVTKYSASN